jgi:hypothetical protein
MSWTTRALNRGLAQARYSHTGIMMLALGFLMRMLAPRAASAADSSA